MMTSTVDHDRRWTEGLIERFIATEDLGLNRFRSLVRFAATHDQIGVTELMRLLAVGAPYPFSKERHQKAVPWHELVARLAATGPLDDVEPTCRWLVRGDHEWTRYFADDDDAPAALSVVGNLDVLRAPRAAIVGTRRASGAGLAFARELAHDLADCGVSVVSGLARGIDGAAHRGVVAGGSRSGCGPVGVLGSGVAVAYPSEHRQLQAQVGEQGLLLSEVEPRRGARSEAFPQRNRIVAQLAQVVIVVESGERGGSLLTVDEATLRGRPILAVPNSPMVRSAVGSNELLRSRDGTGPIAAPCHGVADVLAVLELSRVTAPEFQDDRPEPVGDGGLVLAALGWERRSTSWLADTCGLSLSQVVCALNSLEDGRWIAHQEGRWARVAR